MSVMVMFVFSLNTRKLFIFYQLSWSCCNIFLFTFLAVAQALKYWRGSYGYNFIAYSSDLEESPALLAGRKY